MEQKRHYPFCYRVYMAFSSSHFRRRQLLCFFILFILVSFLSSLFYTLQKKRFLSGVFFFGPSQTNKPCKFDMFNNSLRGPIQADTDSVPSFSDLKMELSHNLSPGGHYVPACKSKYAVAIIVPIRDRQIHLKIFLRHMHPFLQRQNIEYGIIVVEQDDSSPFNRALLFNIGFVESPKYHDYDCFVFHDVDLLPLDDRNYYSCGDEPVHLSASIDAHNYKLMYQNIFGGASMMTKEMMQRVNGFSNLYFGWGGEDDDMSYRVRSHRMHIERYTQEIARYTMMKHAKENHEDRTRLFASSRSRIHEDGLNSLKYQLEDVQLLPLYTWIKVKINQTEIVESQT